jgi:O-antigen ligase
MIGYFIKIIIAYFTVRSVREFLYKYINVMIFLSLLSFVFCFPSLFIDIKHFFQFLMPMPERIEHIYIHNFMIVYHEWIVLDDSYRNASLFWEPAAFGGFLTLAILFLGLFHGKLSRKTLTRKYIILFIALISTLSTTSYIISALLILMNFRQEIFIKKRKLSIFIAALPIVLFVTHQAFTHIPFLKEKISVEVDRALSNDYNFQSTRLGGLLFDWEDIKEKPLIGWGPDPTKRPHNFEEVQYQGNGLSGYLVKFGLLGISLYIYFIYLSFNNISNKSVFFSFYAIFIVLLLLNTEYYLNFPFFHTLLFFKRQHLT